MRRKDREITDFAKIQQIILNCNCCRIGFNDDGNVYIVPLNFGYLFENEKHIFYFHSAKDGRKIELIKQNPYVGFELDTNYKLNTADIACAYSARFQSIIGDGEISFIENSDEKIKGLTEIMKHNTGKIEWTFSEEILKEVCVFKLIVKNLSCKEHL